MNEAAANLSRPGVSSDACSDIFMKAAQGDPLGDRLASAALTHDKDERTLLASLLTRLWSVARLAGGEMRDDIAQKAEKSRVTDARVLKHREACAGKRDSRSLKGTVRQASNRE